jgi:hypothetical protein
MYSLSFILARIIHSVDLQVERGQVPSSIEDKVLYHDAAWGFTVQSDRDASDARHFIFIEFLIERFLLIDEELRSPLEHGAK